MPIDANVQVWLDQAAAHEQVIAPYVRTTQATTFEFHLRVLREGRGGRSETQQQGTVRTAAGTATPLARVSVNAHASDTCDVELRLHTEQAAERIYRFDCPRGDRS